MQKTYILISLVVIIGAAVLVGLNMRNKEIPLVACTMEAKLCPDGSAVGRTGPNCEFTACSEVVPETTPTPTATTGDIVLGLGQKGKVGDLEITLNSIAQDSRCPLGVQCIWAGEVKANITLLGKSKTEAKVISSIDKPYSFDGYNISITDVTRGEYRVTFHIEKDVKEVSANTGTISGRVTLSPTCPVERMPPDPKCAPKAYQTKIEVLSSESGKLVKTMQSASDGNFSVTLPFGFYKIEAGTGTMLPRCSPVAIHLQTVTATAGISCDTGIR